MVQLVCVHVVYSLFVHIFLTPMITKKNVSHYVVIVFIIQFFVLAHPLLQLLFSRCKCYFKFYLVVVVARDFFMCKTREAKLH